MVVLNVTVVLLGAADDVMSVLEVDPVVSVVGPGVVLGRQ